MSMLINIVKMELFMSKVIQEKVLCLLPKRFTADILMVSNNFEYFCMLKTFGKFLYFGFLISKIRIRRNEAVIWPHDQSHDTKQHVTHLRPSDILPSRERYRVTSRDQSRLYWIPTTIFSKLPLFNLGTRISLAIGCSPITTKILITWFSVNNIWFR